MKTSNQNNSSLRVIISGGGTGGHIFPAISIANAIKEQVADAQILFVGASGKMEMEKVPAAGYPIKGIPARGLHRPLYSPKNISVALDYLKCRKQAKNIVTEFKPDFVVGVGGYASAALVAAAAAMNVPVLLQEQNSFAGIVNRKNASKATKICVAYDNMERFFPKNKILITGNPIRKEIVRCTQQLREEGIKFYNLDSAKKTVFVVGGSLGCRTLNNCMKKAILENKINSFQVIWQCGKIYKREIEEFLQAHPCKNVYCTDFIGRMDLAYAAADVVVSRAGAGTISELCIAGKCTVFVPSPNVAEDHQTHNAMALVNKGAAMIVKDAQAEEKLMEVVKNLIADAGKRSLLEDNILLLAKPDAAKHIADECLKLWNRTTKQPQKEEPKNVYFIGIGGIGMSALARYYKSKGCNVSGYDRTQSNLTLQLQQEGIDIHYEDRPEMLPKDINNTLIIYTPAIPADLKELQDANKLGYKVLKRSKALGYIAEGKTCLAISGSHGKTTTSTLLAHIMHSSGIGCNAFLGGISKNYNSNLILSDNNIIVAEADEFDRSFHQLFPHIAVVTATDADHLDIYGTVEAMREAYAQFASQTDKDGFLIVKKGTVLDTSKVAAKVMSYAYNLDSKDAADFYAADIKPVKKEGKETGLFSFTICYPAAISGGSGRIENCTLGIPGWVNIENAIAASAVALLSGVSELQLKQALASFKGVQRRMDVQINTPTIVYIDDYAHHPQEISTTISSLRASFPLRKITAVFQPHLYTRTRDLAAKFAQALDLADSIILLDIYPARELPIEGVTSEIIFNKLNHTDKTLITKEELPQLIEEKIRKKEIDLLVTFGAGNIDRYVETISQIIKENR